MFLLVTSLSLDFVGLIDTALGLVNQYWTLAVIVVGIPMGFLLLGMVLHELSKLIPR